MRGLFVSDLHLFSDRSVGQGHWQQLAQSVEKVDCVVFGGDIFDFRWSRLGSFGASLSAAERWLESAFEQFPQVEWQYVLGNHDCHPRFQDLLQRLSVRHDRFAWHTTHWAVGGNLFVHGDFLDGGATLDHFARYRQRFHESTPRGRVHNALYRWAVSTRVHTVLPAWRHLADATCMTLIDRLPMLDATILRDVRRVIFGHTHVPLGRLACEGIEFCNPGAGIRHLPFRPVYFDCSEGTCAQ
jgi:UDP-2,3-diacylglucosamine hydrolase